MESLRIMPPQVFWPRPKVHSAIVRITLDEDLRRRIADRPFFHQFVRSMFFHRRKLLRGELIAATRDRLEKADVDRLLARLGLDRSVRAEQLDPPTMIALAHALKAELEG